MPWSLCVSAYFVPTGRWLFQSCGFLGANFCLRMFIDKWKQREIFIVTYVDFNAGNTARFSKWTSLLWQNSGSLVAYLPCPNPPHSWTNLIHIPFSQPFTLELLLVMYLTSVSVSREVNRQNLEWVVSSLPVHMRTSSYYLDFIILTILRDLCRVTTFRVVCAVTISETVSAFFLTSCIFHSILPWKSFDPCSSFDSNRARSTPVRSELVRLLFLVSRRLAFWKADYDRFRND